MKNKLFFLLLISFFLAHDGNKNVEPFKINSSINIDGILDEPEWIDAPSISDFIVLDSDDSASENEKTEVKILYDDSSLYFGISVFNIENISRKIGEDDDFDNIFYENSDYFVIEIDSHHDHQSSYGFAINASNVLSDYIIFNNEFYDDNWDGEWNALISYSDKVWKIECEIPIKNLRFKNMKNLIMGINFLRYKLSDNAYFSWTRLPESGGLVSHYGHLKNLNLNWNENNFFIKPNLYYSSIDYNDSFYSYSFDENGNISGLNLDNINKFSNNDINRHIGLDIKYLINSSTSLDFTFNPEFYIEQDPSEINNSAFETYFEERRPFFLEQKQIFITPIEIFYSRRIGSDHFNFFSNDEANDNVYFELKSNVDGALKFTGSSKKNFSYGLILAQSRIDDSFLNIDNNKVLYSIARVKKSIFNEKSYIGILNTDFNFNKADAKVHSIDGIFDFSKYGLEFSYQYAKSFNMDIIGYGSSYELDFFSEELNISGDSKDSFYIESWFRYDDYDENFNIDNLGYLFRNNIRTIDFGLVLSFYNENLFDMSSLSFKSIYSKNYANVVLEDLFSIDWTAKLLNNWAIKFGYTESKEAYLDKLYDDYFINTYLVDDNQRNIKVSPQKNYYFNIESDLRKRMQFSALVNYFKSYDSEEVDDEGFSSILTSKINFTEAVNFELIVDNLNYDKTYQFLKIRKINLPNGGNDESMLSFNERNDYRYLFTNSKNSQISYVMRMNAYMKDGPIESLNDILFKCYVEYFNYENIWNQDSFSYIDLNTEPFSYPEPHPNYIGNNEEDILLYSAKYSSLSYNFVLDIPIENQYFFTFGIQFNKAINGRSFYSIKDIVDFDIEDENEEKAEIFFDKNIFISLNMFFS